MVRKQDIYIAKNYLTSDEIDTLNRLTVLFLDSAELRVKEHRDLTLGFWRQNVDTLLNFQSKKVLVGAGSISTKQMEDKVDAVYKEFDQRRKAYEALEADKEETEELKRLESEIKSRKNK